MRWLASGLLILATVSLVVICQLLLKWRAGIHAAFAGNDGTLAYLRPMLFDPWMWLALISAALAALIWMLVIRRADLAFAYPLLALVFLAIPLAAHFLFAEPLPLVRIVGLSLIAVGVLLVAQTA